MPEITDTTPHKRTELGKCDVSYVSLMKVNNVLEEMGLGVLQV